jgi:hypothetical protein
MVASCKGAHFPKDIMRMGSRWSGGYPLSIRHVADLMLATRENVRRNRAERTL